MKLLQKLQGAVILWNIAVTYYHSAHVLYIAYKICCALQRTHEAVQNVVH